MDNPMPTNPAPVQIDASVIGKFPWTPTQPSRTADPPTSTDLKDADGVQHAKLADLIKGNLSAPPTPPYLPPPARPPRIVPPPPVDEPVQTFAFDYTTRDQSERGKPPPLRAEPDVESRFLALMESDQRRKAEIGVLSAMVADLHGAFRAVDPALTGFLRRLETLEAAPAARGGWHGWFFGALTSRRFQLTVGAILSAAALYLSGATGGTETLVGVIGVIVAYLGSEGYTDAARAKARAPASGVAPQARVEIKQES